VLGGMIKEPLGYIKFLRPKTLATLRSLSLRQLLVVPHFGPTSHQRLNLHSGNQV
jgi:hypothetical protein